jgi:hypothetical protein
MIIASAVRESKEAFFKAVQGHLAAFGTAGPSTLLSVGRY